MSATTNPCDKLSAGKIRAQRQIERLEADRDRQERDSGRIKYLLIPAFTLWPAGFYWDWPGAAAVFLVLITFWGVAVYLSFFHKRETRRQLADAQDRLQKCNAGLATHDCPGFDSAAPA